jgi:hypothetical protein
MVSLDSDKAIPRTPKSLLPAATNPSSKPPLAAALLPSEKLSRIISRPLRDSYLITGRWSYWWNGGGDDSVHSSVVAPSPHGLSAASCFRANA